MGLAINELEYHQRGKQVLPDTPSAWCDVLKENEEGR
jgi:hypothetical protein